MATSHQFDLPSGAFWRETEPIKKVRSVSEVFKPKLEKQKSLKRKRESHSASRSSSKVSQRTGKQESLSHSSNSAESDSDNESDSDDGENFVDSYMGVSTRFATRAILSAVEPPLYVAASSIPSTLQGGASGLSGKEDLEEERRIGLLMAILHRCLQASDWVRASRAVGLLLRCGKRLEHMLSLDGKVTEIAAEVLLHRTTASIENDENSEVEEESDATQSSTADAPDDIQLPSQASQVTLAGIEATINFYRRLNQLLPKGTGNTHKRIFWLPAVFRLRIYHLETRAQQDLGRLSPSKRPKRRSAEAHKIYVADGIRQSTLTSVMELDEDLEQALQKPHDLDQELLNLGIMVAEWEATLIFPQVGFGRGLFNVVLQAEKHSRDERAMSVQSSPSEYASSVFPLQQARTAAKNGQNMMESSQRGLRPEPNSVVTSRSSSSDYPSTPTPAIKARSSIASSSAASTSTNSLPGAVPLRMKSVSGRESTGSSTGTSSRKSRKRESVDSSSSPSTNVDRSSQESASTSSSPEQDANEWVDMVINQYLEIQQSQVLEGVDHELNLDDWDPDRARDILLKRHQLLRRAREMRSIAKDSYEDTAKQRKRNQSESTITETGFI
jgi:hypothetical protein